LDSLIYRLRVAGPSQLWRDSKARLKEHFDGVPKGMQAHVLGDPRAKLSLLYVHSGWAIYNVGRLWFSEVPGVKCTMVTTEEFMADPKIQAGHSAIIFGYTSLALASDSVPRTIPEWICVHDPCELFQDVPQWRTLEANPKLIERLKKSAKVICISREVQCVLRDAGVESELIPTTSQIPIVSVDQLKKEQGDRISATTVGRIYPRKRFEWFWKIRSKARSKGIPIHFRAKLNRAPLSESAYIEFLDRASIYLVTSYQEGGPLPAMDAMRRGLVVLSTPVGQMVEILQDGKNGFLCETPEDFVERLSMLARDPELLRSMRLASHESIQRMRSRDVIDSAVQRALGLPQPA